MPKSYVVNLTEEERQKLQKIVSTGKATAYKIKRANILLNIDVNGQGWTDSEAAAALSCHRNTVANIRKRLVEEGLEAVLTRKKRENPPRQPICDRDCIAKIIALRSSEPPKGHNRWTLRLLAETIVELEIVPSISHETVRQILKEIK